MSLSQIDLREGIADQTPPETTNAGAAFWAYLSPRNDTAKVVKDFQITLTQGTWTGQMTRTTPTLQSPGMSGIFKVTVMASFGGAMVKLDPLPDTNPNVGCNSNCKAMIGIVADPNGTGAHYWTVWDALCNGPANSLEATTD